MIKLIIFDLDNTLYPTFEQVRKCREAAINEMMKYGLKGTKKELIKELNGIVKEQGSNSQKHFNEIINKQCPDKTRREKYYLIGKGVTAYSIMKAKSMNLYPDTKETLKKLLDKKYKIVILTDGIQVKQFDKVNRLGLDKYFKTDVWVTKDKTNTKAIKEILKENKIKQQEALLVGDRRKSDIQAAKNTGIKSCQLMKGPYTNEHGSEPDIKIKNLTELLKKISMI